MYVFLIHLGKGLSLCWRSLGSALVWGRATGIMLWAVPVVFFINVASPPQKGFIKGQDANSIHWNRWLRKSLKRFNCTFLTQQHPHSQTRSSVSIRGQPGAWCIFWLRPEKYSDERFHVRFRWCIAQEDERACLLGSLQIKKWKWRTALRFGQPLNARVG